MWYFAWILGVLLACAFGIINVMWMETEEMLGTEKDKYVSLKDEKLLLSQRLDQLNGYIFRAFEKGDHIGGGFGGGHKKRVAALDKIIMGRLNIFYL